MTEQHSRTPLILAFLCGGILLIVVSLVANRLDHQPPRSAPPIRIVSARDTSVAASHIVHFVTPAPLSLSGMGWTAEALHPHALVDGQVVMSAATDIQHVAADTFAWTFPALMPGPHPVGLFWADMSHAPAGDTAWATLDVR